MALAAALVAVAALTLSANAQGSCRLSEDFGALRSHQTITRVGLLNSSSCRLDGVRYYDYYSFQLTGAGEVRLRVSSPDFPERIALNTNSGEFLAGHNGSSELVRTLPAGRYLVLAISTGNERAGSYTLTIRAGQLAAPPPTPPPPETTTTGDDADRDDEQVVPPGDPEVVSGHVIARVHPLPENDRRGRYRIEFGFLSAEVLASGTDRTAVVNANTHLLPPQRYLNEASLLARSRANDRRWLRSSPVDVLPLEGDDASLGGEPLLTGRIIARWSPTDGGVFRVEFGFLPNWAFEAAGDDTQRAAELYAHLLPEPGRYLWESRINSELRRDQPRWLTSSVVELVDGGDPPCDAVTITPAGVPIPLSWGERISDVAIATVSGQLAETFQPVVVSGLPPGLTYDVDESRADRCEYQVTVSGTIPPQTPTRDYNISITAEGAVGDPTTQTVRITPGGTVLSIGEWGGYNPATTSIGGSVGIVQPRVVSPFPAPPGVVWSFETLTTDVCSVNSRTGALTLIAEGACQVTVTASAPGYRSDTASAQVTVDPPAPCVISWSGYSRSSIDFGDTAPTHLEPQCRVNGRMHSPEWRYSVAPGSSDVCSVNEATGALTINGAGQCRINLTNIPKPPEYGAGSADASVRVEPGDPDLRWQGYSPDTTQLDDPAPRLLRPTADARSIEFSYRALTPSICEVDSETGALDLMREGNCIVMVSTSGNPNYRTETARATVDVGPGIDPPRVTISCSPSSIDEGESVTCSVTRNRGGLIDDYDWSARGGSPSSGSSSTYSPRFSSEGEYTVSLIASNSAGDDDDSTTVDVGPGIDPPRVTISCSPSSIDEGESVTCSVTRNRGGLIDDYDWSARGGSPSSGSSSTYSPRFSSAGSYTVRLIASNSAGDDDASTTVGVGPPPVAEPEISSISCPSSAEVDENITCTVRLDPRGGTPDTYEWSGGSASRSNRSTYSPSFSSSGRQTVSLTVRNSAGRDNASTTVRVVPRPNRDPETVGSIPTLTVGVGWGSDEVDLGSYFRDPDGDSLTYEVDSSNSSRASVRVVGRNRDELTVTGRRAGSVTITVTASDGKGGTATQSFSATAAPRPSWFVYCQPDSIRVWYLRGAYGTRHHLDITASQAEGLWGSSWWNEIVTMSSSDCAKWPIGPSYDYNDARWEVERV